MSRHSDSFEELIRQDQIPSVAGLNQSKDRKIPLSPKVSQFPVPIRSPRVKKRGAELNKLLFIEKMDKVYFSILKMQDIKEDLEPIEPASEFLNNPV